MKSRIILQLSLSCVFLFTVCFCKAQDSKKPPVLKTPLVTTIFHKLGDGFIRIRSYQYGNAKSPFFIALHDDERTAVTATEKLLAKKGGTLVRIDNNKKRNIRFRMNNKNYTFDPNRIFSQDGINQTLSLYGMTNSRAIQEVDKFAKRILQLLPASPACIISLHNNSNGKFSITSYLDGQERERDARAIRLAPEEDPDDLFLTTDTVLFAELAKGKYNMVLQDNSQAKKDGSLSIYCGEKNMSYLNCETEHGRLRQYENMINFAVNYLEVQNTKRTVGPLVYQYRLSPGQENMILPQGTGVYFGEKKVGTVVTSTGRKNTSIEMIESFPLYDNMDFFVIRAEPGYRLEIRIDPTRSRNIYDAEKDIIPIQSIR